MLTWLFLLALGCRRPVATQPGWRGVRRLFWGHPWAERASESHARSPSGLGETRSGTLRGAHLPRSSASSSSCRGQLPSRSAFRSWPKDTELLPESPSLASAFLTSS